MMQVVLAGDPDPIEWGRKFTELVCREWYRKDRMQDGSDAGDIGGNKHSPHNMPLTDG